MIKNFLSLSLSHIIIKGLGLVVTAYLARRLGANGFGKISFALAILSYFALLVDLGLGTFGTKEIAQSKEKVQKYVDNILAIKLLASLGTFILLTGFVYFIYKPVEVKKLLLFYGFSLFIDAFTIAWVFRGIEKMEFIAASQIAHQLIYVSLIFWIVKSPNQLLKVPLINLGAGIIEIAILFLVFRKNFRFPNLEFDFGFWKQILKQSLPIGFSFIMITIYYSFDSVMLGFMKGEEIVGWYSAAYKIILIISAFGGMYQFTIFPILSNFYKTSIEKLKVLMENSLTLAFLILIPIVVLVFSLAPIIIRLIYGIQYLNSILILQILIWNVPLIFISGLFAHFLLACGEQKRYMINVTVGAATNLILNVILIPPVGMIGAAIATIVAELMVLIMGYRGSKNIVKLSWSRVFSCYSFWQRTRELVSLMKREKVS